jgi:hypothetical protein
VVNVGAREPRGLSKLTLREAVLLAKMSYKPGKIKTVNKDVLPF